MKGMVNLIYLDHAATTPLCDAAKHAIIEHLNDFGNPSSNHELGRQARMLIEDARERIAKCINAEPDEVFFTSGGSEANTWALNKENSLSTAFEHHSINATFHDITVNKNGIIDVCDNTPTIENLFAMGKTVSNGCMVTSYAPINLVSCMHVNNEIGTIQPIKEIANAVHRLKFVYSINPLFHTDAVQALPYVKIDVKDINCDMLSASGHKVGAMKGVGFLYAKNNGPYLDPLIYGGKQEFGKRPGTENVLGVISMAAALEDTVRHMDERNKHIKYLRDKLLERLLLIPGAHLNGSIENRVPGNINVRFDGIPGARLVTLCSLYGIYISSGSACNEGVSTPSHVLKAIGLSDEEALSSVRITIGHTNTEEEIDTAANIITKLIERIRHED